MDTKRMPVLFIGHGSPMNAIADNPWSRAFARLAADLPTPRAILAVSAHWFVDGVQTTGDHRPETIHDFGGFPQALFDMRYPAPGSPELAQQVVDLLGAQRASVSLDWGLDHGTWSVLHWLRPTADLPVVQLSLDRRLAPSEHVALGRALAPLRDEGVLILASGNITHNLRDAMARARQAEPETPPWAASFDADVSAAMAQRDTAWLADALETEAGHHSHPSPDHYLPVLYAAAAAGADDTASCPVTGFDLGSLSMRAVLYSP